MPPAASNSPRGSTSRAFNWPLAPRTNGFWSCTTPWTAWPPRNPRRRESSRRGSSEAFRWKRQRPRLGCPVPPPTGNGPSPAPGWQPPWPEIRKNLRQIGRAARINYIGPDGEPRMTAPPRSLKELFLAALEVSPEDRAAWLERECAADAGLCEHLRLMLAAHDAPQSLLDRPAGSPEASLPREGVGPTVDQPMAKRPGTVIGPYKLLEQIGEGGMGTVFMAEQAQPVQRKVALKLIKSGMDSRRVVARFEAERQALALMDHPHIAKVLDAGTTDSGLPYFVMELVKGVPITNYCDDRNLTPRERLELFMPVCHAVQHAHQKGIIHRDLKPSNVLVALYDDKAVPKIIDFGVAKATGQKLTEQTMFTHYGQLV